MAGVWPCVGSHEMRDIIIDTGWSTSCWMTNIDEQIDIRIGSIQETIKGIRN